MASLHELNKAIAAHGLWKLRLKNAIESGVLDVPLAVVQSDNACPFGQWLYGLTLTAEDKASVQYAEVMSLHAEFHRIAGAVANHALSGQKLEAHRLLEDDFAKASVKLSAAMFEWKKISV